MQPTGTLADPLGDPGSSPGLDVRPGAGADPAGADPAAIGFVVTEPSAVPASPSESCPPNGYPVSGRGTMGPEVTGRILVAVLLAAAQVVGSIATAPLRPDQPAPGIGLTALLLAGPAVFAITGRPLVRAAVAVVAADVCLVIGQPVGPVALTPVLCLVLAVLAGRHLAAWVVAGAGLAGGFVGSWFGPHPVLASQVVLVAGWASALLALADAVRGRRMLAEVWARARAQARLRVAGEQRAEAARDLQDGVAHRIQLVTAQAAAGLALLDVNGPAAAADARDTLLAIRDAGDDALAALRLASDVLAAPGELVPRTVCAGLDALMSLASKWAGTGLVVRAAGDAGPLPPEIDKVAYRVVQEALANVARHSCALHTDLALHRDADLLRLVISDPGPPRLPAQFTGESGTTAGRGLTRLRERVEALGGALSAGPDGAGWSVHVVLPVGSVS